jgi:Uma2 family endonuclease
VRVNCGPCYGRPVATSASSQPRTGTLSAEEMLRLPDRDRRLELIEGELHEMPPAGADHGTIALRIGALLEHAAREHGGRAFAAETGFVLSRNPDTVRAPDAAYVTAQGAERAGNVRGYWPGPPDLAVEVVSPGDAYSELHEKALAWLEAGAQLVLVADPTSRRVTLYRSREDVSVIAGDEIVDCTAVVPSLASQTRTLFT